MLSVCIVHCSQTMYFKDKKNDYIWLLTENYLYFILIAILFYRITSGLLFVVSLFVFDRL